MKTPVSTFVWQVSVYSRGKHVFDVQTHGKTRDWARFRAFDAFKESVKGFLPGEITLKVRKVKELTMP